MDFEKQCEDRFQTMAHELNFARIHRQDGSRLFRPESKTIFAIVAAGESASRLLLAPVHGRNWSRILFSKTVRMGRGGETGDEKYLD